MKSQRLVCLALATTLPLACDFWFDGGPYRDGDKAPSTEEASVTPGPTTDARPIRDDAGASEDAAALGFCDGGGRAVDDGATVLLFCDDFDGPTRTTIQQGGWSPTGMIGAFVTEAPESPPRAFRLLFDGGGPTVYATTAFGPVQQSLAIELSVRPASTYSGQFIFVVTLAPGCNLTVTSGSVGAYCPGGTTVLSNAGAIAPERWTPLRLTVQRTAMPSKLHIVFRNGEGPLALTTERDFMLPDGGVPVTSVTLTLGSGPATARGHLDFDDVRITSND